MCLAFNESPTADGVEEQWVLDAGASVDVTGRMVGTMLCKA